MNDIKTKFEVSELAYMYALVKYDVESIKDDIAEGDYCGMSKNEMLDSQKSANLILRKLRHMLQSAGFDPSKI